MRIVNFFGGPGAGKTTSALGLAYELKKRWFNAELVNEVAKELIYEGSAHLLSHQNHIFAQQEYRLARLTGHVDVVVSDSPLLLSSYYAPRDYAVSFRQSVFDFFSNYENINIFVRRSHVYSESGRLQNQEESDAIANSMEQFLLDNGIPYYAVTASDANPRYLLYWLVQEKLLSLPTVAKPFEPEDIPPEGWIMPSLLIKRDEQGNVLLPGSAVSQHYVADWVRTVGSKEQ